VSATDRGTWRLVARRDFWVRLRERSFLVSTVLNMTVISVLVLARSVMSTGTTTYDLGVVGGPDVQAIANASVAFGEQGGVTIRLVQLEGETDAQQALADGSVDAVLSVGRLVGWSTIDDVLRGIVQTSAHYEIVQRVLDGLDAPPGEEASATTKTPLDEGILHPAPENDPRRRDNGAVAFVAVLLLYGQLFGYGIWVATGVIEEKASRVVEMLLSAIRPRQLLAGKIVGIGTLGLCQLAVIAGFALTLARFVGGKSLPPGAIWAALLVIGWFILGFAFYATLFAAAGSLVSRMEELQNVIVPINLTILVSFFISVGSLQAPNSTIAVIASILPVSAPLAMPVRIVLGAATPPQIALSLFLLIGSTVALVPVGARLYEGAVLRTGGRVSIREAWRRG
jgi:ABC-2 type transport system permease protein